MKRQDITGLIIDLRSKGLTLEQIGNKIGVSRQRVHQIYHIHKIESVSWTKGLSVRSQSILKHLKLNSLDEVQQAIKDGRIKPKIRKNFGVGSYTELIKWAGTSK